MKRIVILFLFLLPFAFTVKAQVNKINQFQHDSIKFLDDLEVYLNTGLADKSGVKDFVKKFKIAWESSAYTPYYRRVTYHVADEMLEKKMQVYPTFQTFLNVMENFVRSEQTQAKFDQWYACLQKQMKQKPYTNLNTYLSICENLFGWGIMFKSPTVNWSTDNNDYEFNCDEVLQEIVFTKLNLKCTLTKEMIRL